MTGEAGPRAIPPRATFALFAAVLVLHFIAATVGWRHGMLPGNTFRQAQTAVSTLFIQRDGDFSLAYPTPVLGKPWSVPMEFPLYEWTVAGLNHLTGGPLVETARFVSLLCFYLALPALWLLLRESGIDPARRWLALAFVPAIPIHIYYSRAFLIESMALMFACWFLAAIVAGLNRRHRGWLTLAAAAGVGAALVKITTLLLFLVPAAAVVVLPGWTARVSPSLPLAPAARRDRVWLAAATLAAPFAAVIAWVLYTDKIKALNPAADMLRSGAQRTYNFGHFADRFSADYWPRWLNLASHAVVHPAVFSGAVVVGIFGPRQWRGPIWCGLALFCLGPAVFPFLYAWHDYYYFANAVFLACALGIAAIALLDSRLPRFLGAGLIVAALALQGRLYWSHYLPEQRVAGNGDSGLTQFLFDLTDENDVIVVAGQDWNSMVPWSARRRALMIRRGFEFNPPYLEQAFGNLAGEFTAALILTGDTRDNAALLRLAESKLNLHPEPFAEFLDSTVYVNRSLRDEWSARAPFSYDRLRVLHRNEQAAPLLARDVAALHSRSVFGRMHPRPVRFEVPFGLSTFWPTPDFVLNAHATTRLWFDPSAGPHRARIEFGILDAAWQGANRTDGVEFVAEVERKGEPARRVWSRLLDPAKVAADRGEQAAEFDFEMPPEARLKLSTLPGPSGINSYDWAYVASFTLK
ncbi:MAG: hypothetical protein JWM88_3270 [Verrucomicrobia bacterium]|nr:hypothetical protein [Verrucomicrobiota bacterium]